MANSYLSKSASSGNSTTFTISAWIKRTVTGTATQIFNAHKADSIAGHTNFGIDSNDRLDLSTWSVNVLTTNRKLRDTNAFYHVVVQVDSTNSTADDRVKMWINGVQETSFSTRNNPSSSQAFSVNDSASTHTIGAGNQGSGQNQHFNGYISHFVLVDGSVVAPTSFGETDSTSGIWKFKSPSGVTFGTNGAHLKFENAGALGTDSSGNSNTYVVNGNLKQALDTPSNVYCTMNSLDNHFASSTFTNGNNTVQTTGGNYTWNTSTLGLTTGKWYWEVKYEAKSNADNFNLIGIAERPTESSTQFLGGVSAIANYGYYSDNGGVFAKSGSTTSYGNTYTVGDIIGVALDLDNNKLYFHKNGTYQNSGVPTSGSTGTGAISIDAVSSLTFGQYFVAAGDYGGGSFNVTNSFNFGNGFFGTTAITSAGSNGNESLFEYDVPTGYYAINTKNLNTYG